MNESYADEFTSIITGTQVLRVLEDFDATSHAKDPSPEALAKAQDRFSFRVARVLTKSTNPVLRRFFQSRVDEAPDAVKSLVTRYMSEDPPSTPSQSTQASKDSDMMVDPSSSSTLVSGNAPAQRL